MGQGSLGQVEHGKDIGAESSLQLVWCDVQDRVFQVLLPGVIYQYVYPPEIHLALLNRVPASH